MLLLFQVILSSEQRSVQVNSRLKSYLHFFACDIAHSVKKTLENQIVHLSVEKLFIMQNKIVWNDKGQTFLYYLNSPASLNSKHSRP